MRDMIRVAAEIPGDNTFDAVINNLITHEINRLTNLSRYEELHLIDQDLSFVGSDIEYVLLPTTLQHLDVENISYIPDSTEDQVELLVLRKWSKWFGQYNYTARMWRRAMYDDSGTLKRSLQILPKDDIDYTDGRIRINYWKSYTWNDTDQFPITRLEPVVQDNVAARVASLQKTGLAKKLKSQAAESFIAARATE